MLRAEGVMEAAPGHRGGPGGGDPGLMSSLRDKQGQGQEPGAALHIIPDFKENKRYARPCLPCSPSPGALKLPLSWILRLRPGAGSIPLLLPAVGGRRAAAPRQKLLL